MTETQPVDPVCGMTLATWDGEFDRSHAGTAYHFCSPQCASRFAEHPESYTTSRPRPIPRRARERVTLPIFGLGCGGGGSSTIQRALLRTSGVLCASVSPATEMAYVEYHAGLLGHDELVDAIEKAGYFSLRATGEPRSVTRSGRQRETGRKDGR